MATLSRDEYKRREENQQQQTADRHCIVLVKAERERVVLLRNWPWNTEEPMNESPITSMYEHKLKILHGAMPLHDPFTPSDVPCEAKGAALVHALFCPIFHSIPSYLSGFFVHFFLSYATFMTWHDRDGRQRLCWHCFAWLQKISGGHRPLAPSLH